MPHMQSLTKLAMFAIALFVAFVLGQHQTTIAAAQASQQWQYRLLKINVGNQQPDGTNDVKGLDTLTAQGWEPVSTNESWLLIKRHK